MTLRLTVFITLLITSTCLAEELKHNAHIKSQFTGSYYKADDLNSFFYKSSTFDKLLELRNNIEYKTSSIKFVSQTEAIGIEGDGFRQRNKLNNINSQTAIQFDILPNDSRRLFDLTSNSSSNEYNQLALRFDRLYIDYQQTNYNLRLGRQALSWGNGLVFNVLDFINPFAPTEIDRDYKAGDVILFQQINIGSDSDVQFVFLPRRDLQTEDVESSESSYALKYRKNIIEKNIVFEGVVSKHLNDNLYGTGLSYDLEKAILKFDLLYSDLSSGEDTISLIANYDRAWNIYNRNFHTIVEYFRNGYGSKKNSLTTDSQNSELVKRIQNGEVFTQDTDYLAIALQLEMTPLVNLYINDLINIRDNSHILQTKFIIDIFESSQVFLGVNIPLGDRNTEFGGQSLNNTEILNSMNNIDFVPINSIPRQAYVRLAYYF